jgi:hypothetical protein
MGYWIEAALALELALGWWELMFHPACLPLGGSDGVQAMGIVAGGVVLKVAEGPIREGLRIISSVLRSNQEAPPPADGKTERYVGIDRRVSTDTRKFIGGRRATDRAA